jgi:hypothetical protein
MGYALFQDDKQISKPHPHRETVRVEAYERGLILDCGRYGTSMAGNVEIREACGRQVNPGEGE